MEKNIAIIIILTNLNKLVILNVPTQISSSSFSFLFSHLKKILPSSLHAFRASMYPLLKGNQHLFLLE